MPFGKEQAVSPLEKAAKVISYSWLINSIVEDLTAMRDSLKGNPRLVDARDIYGRTGLMVSADLVDIGRALLLLAFGAKINLKTDDEYQVTPLHILIRKKDLPATLRDKGIRLVKVFLEHGADVKALDAHKCIPLHYASRIIDDKLRSEVFDLLMKAGSDINAQDEHGNTPLHYAVNDLNFKAPDYFFEEVLNKYGNLIDPSKRNEMGQTVVEYALRLSLMDVVRVLCRSGKWPCSREEMYGILR